MFRVACDQHGIVTQCGGGDEQVGILKWRARRLQVLIQDGCFFHRGQVKFQHIVLTNKFLKTCILVGELWKGQTMSNFKEGHGVQGDFIPSRQGRMNVL